MPAQVVDCVNDGDFALTFDDGPSPVTASLLDILAEEGVKATFFVVGVNVYKEGLGDVLRRARAEGHEVVSHSMTHTSMPSLSLEEVRQELFDNDYAIEREVCRTPRIFRPPYGAINDDILAVSASMG